MSDQNDELESQVAELQAAVDGLTEELVEVKARLRELEDQETADVEPSAEASAEKGGDTVEARESEATARLTESQSDDVNSEESTEGSNDGASEDSDIIIA